MEGSFPNAYGRNKIHPQAFALLVACASIMMMFAAWTSAYLVRQAAGNWLEFSLPQVFTLSTVIILLSSFTLHLSYRAFLKGNEQVYKYGLVATVLLGVAFLYTQYQGWLTLDGIGIELTTNPSGSFVYVFSYVHAAHVVGGIAILALATAHAFLLGLKVTPKRKHRFELTLIYWHFVDLLWVYLFFFLMTQM
ncbi:MAG: cytochrome c oxidase subunit 3 [Haliscomenobacter sp.]|nr:cytochrome c oxidase subunit 3 [Haliscomenobacter sp.]MBK9490536.1 cytochrome c oxidase subunit 3 [Haliscomenobacter sp.]